MPYQAEQYAEQLAQLMPRGVIWEQLTQQDSEFSNWLAALAEEFARIDARAKDLLDETDPRTLYELLYEWEQYLALPDDCVGQLDTLEKRREAVLEVLTSVGGQSKQYFIDLAEKLGFVVTISEFKPFTVKSKVNESLYNRDWLFTWRINGPATNVKKFTVKSGVNESLASWGSQKIECIIKSRKPAHTIVLFVYS